MANLGRELLEHRDEILQRWYAAWRNSPHPHHDVGEKEIKDKLPVQLQVIGEQLQQLAEAEKTDRMWDQTERLDPELRLAEGIPVEDVVQVYKLVVGVVRDWIHERSLDVTFAEYSYFYDALFELAAESTRRYTKYQAEEVSRERAEYLAGLTHQMRSPLSAISLAVHLLAQTGPAVDAGTLDRIHRNVHRLRVLVEGVMRLERFKPNELPVRPMEVPLAQCIDEIVSDLEPEAAHKGLKLEVHVSRDLRATIDPELLRDALSNLVDNAIKYTPSGFVRIEVDEEAEEVLFKVTDSGPGISAERKKELFTPVHPQAAGGVGIGLAVMHRAVTAQGGTLGVESKPGEGSTFWFRLPRDVKPAGSSEQE